MNRLYIRIKKARLDAGLTQQELGDAVGLSRSAISLWESATTPEIPTISHLFAVAKACGVRPDWLLVGERHNVSQSNIVNAKVPILEYSEVVTFLLNGSHSNNDKMDSSIVCPVPHGERTFVLGVRGQSMTSPNHLETSYPPDTQIFCDPDRVDDIVSGSPVLAMLDGEAIFKIYVKDGAKVWLKSLNPEYEKITEPFDLVAKVIGSFKKT